MQAEKSHTNLTDDQLIRLHRKAKDNQWLGVLLQRYTTLLLGVAIKYMKDKDVAADCVQQVFLKALTSFPETEIQNFKGWLYILMRNYCFQLLRDKKYHQTEDSLYDQKAAEEADFTSLKKYDWTLDQMHESLAQLEEEQRTCVKMFYLEKKTYNQITEHTGYSFMQVKSYIQNGKRNLKKLLLGKLKDSNNI